MINVMQQCLKFYDLMPNQIPDFSEVVLDKTLVAYCVIPLCLPSNRLVQILLAPVGEALDGFSDATQRAVDLVRVHVLRVVLHHAARHTDIKRNACMHFYIKYAAEVKYSHMNLQTYTCEEAVLLTDKQTDLEHEKSGVT